MTQTTSVALLELQVWASRALIAAGFPGGAVDQAARLVALAQVAHDEAAAGFVADLPRIAARDHAVPEMSEDGRIDGRGLHALAVAPAVLDLACARAGTTWRVMRSPGAWVLPGVALQGASRGRTVLAAAPGHAVVAWSGEGGTGFAEATGQAAAVLVAAAGLDSNVPADGYVVAAPDGGDIDALRAAATRVVDPAAHVRRMAALRETGFTLPRALWDGITAWGWKMLVPTSDRSKSQAGGDMGEG